MTHLVIIVDKVGETSKHTIVLNNEHGLYSPHFSLKDVRCKSELVDRPTQQTNTIDIAWKSATSEQANPEKY